MQDSFILTEYLNEFIKDANVQPIGIGCSGDKVIKITKPDGIYFLKYSANPGIKSEYEKLQWLQSKLSVPEIISYEEQKDIHYLLTHALNGEMVCTPGYAKNWQDGLKVIQQAFEMLWSVDIADCPFDERLENKLKRIKDKLDNNLINPEDIRSEFLEQYGGMLGLYKYLIKNKPNEQLCFSHGDTSLPNIFGTGHNLNGFIDVSDCGISDIWFDIAVTAKSIKRNYGDVALQPFYDFIKEKLGNVDYDAIEYYVKLVEF